MKTDRKLNRRSFFARVAGAVSGGAVVLIAGRAAAQDAGERITDCDSGSNSDRPGQGRGGASGISDTDSGANSDPPCRGRRNFQWNNPHGGRGTERTNITDRDSGANADPANYGTGWNRGEQGYTGVTDSDRGANRDPVGHGRGPRR